MKKWLFILLISFFVFMPKDVFAAAIENYRPSAIYYFDPQQNITQFTGYSLAGLQNSSFYIFQTQNDVSKIEYRYNATTDMLNHTNDYSFLIFMPNYKLGNISGYVANDVKPIVLLEGSVCSVQGTSTYLTSGVTFGQTFAAKCENVEIPSSNFSVQVISAPANFNNGLTGSPYYGIGSFWQYTPRDSVAGSLDGIREEQEKTNEKLDDLNESITDSDISGASDSAGGFFTDFKDDDYGLSDIVTLPLTFIQGLANASCSELSLPLPFVDEDVELPCMSSIYENYFGPFLTIYQIITFGIVGYWVCVNTLRLVNNFKNPDNDEVEVLDL